MNPKLKKALPFIITAVVIIAIIVTVLLVKGRNNNDPSIDDPSNAVLDVLGQEDSIDDSIDDLDPTADEPADDDSSDDDSGNDVALPDPDNFKLPKNKDAVLNFYKVGLSKTGSKLKRTSYTRELSSLKMTALKQDAEKLMGSEWPNIYKGVNDILKKGNVTSKTANDLKALSSGEVASATAKESGSNVILTIKLNNASRNMSNMTRGYAGYVGSIDAKEIEQIMKQSVDALADGLLTVKSIQSMNINLSGGQYTVTMTKTGEIKKVSFTGSESGSGTAVVSLKGMGSPKAEATVGMKIRCDYAS